MFSSLVGSLNVVTSLHHPLTNQYLLSQGVMGERFNGQSALIVAIQNNLDSTALTLIELGLGINDPAEHGMTPLMLAARMGNFGLVRALIRAGAAMKAKGRFFNVAHHAWISGNQGVILLVYNPAMAFVDTPEDLDRKAEIDKTYTLENISRLYQAIKEDDLVTVRRWILFGKAHLNAKNNEKLTPLLTAILNKKTAAMKMLIDAGAHLYVQGTFNFLSTHCDMHSLPVRHMLFKAHEDREENGLFFNENNHSDWLPFAIEHGYLKSVMQLFPLKNRDVNADISLLLLAVQHQQHEIIKFLLSQGVNMDQEWNGKLPLIVAIENHDKTSVQLLLDAGAKICSSAVEVACNKSTDVYVDMLVNAHEVRPKSSMDIRPNNINPLLFFSARKGYLKTTKELLQLNEKVITHKDDYGYTVLMYLVAQGDVELVQYLLDKGVSLDTKSNEGVTVLGYAISYNRPQVVAALIKGGVDVNAPISTATWDETPLQLAMVTEKANPDIVEMLLHAGARIDEKKHPGVTPLQFAESQSEPNDKIIARIKRFSSSKEFVLPPYESWFFKKVSDQMLAGQQLNHRKPRPD